MVLQNVAEVGAVSVEAAVAADVEELGGHAQDI
jgi:hypothetical protein